MELGHEGMKDKDGRFIFAMQDDDGNEVAPGSASAALGEKTNAKAAAGDAPPAKKAPKAPTGGGIASFFGKK